MIRQFQVAALAGLVLVVVYALSTRYDLGTRLDEQSGPVVSVAVSACDTASTDPSIQRWADDVHNDMLARLARHPELRVLSRTSLVEFKNYDLETQELGEKLNVSFVLECDVSQINSHFVVTAKLMNIAEDSYIWTGSFETDIDSAAETPKEIAESVVQETPLR